MSTMPGKRPYRLGKRQASVDQTKRRIVAAASEEYQLNGIEDTSMQAVARRADVAPGTVLYHYAAPEDLAQAVVESWTAEMRMPTPESIDPEAPLEQRIQTLVEELYGLYERSEGAYRVYLKSTHHPVMARAEGLWQKNVSEMLGRALGERVSERQALQVVAALVNPGFRGTLLMNGLSAQKSMEVATELAVAWLSTPPP